MVRVIRLIQSARASICTAVSLLLLISCTNSGNVAGTVPVTAGVSSASGPQPSLAPMLQRVTPAVVNISTQGRVAVRPNPLLNDPFFRRFFDLPEEERKQQPRERRTRNLGSGVIVDADKGHVVTNAHVVEGADSITVTLRDGRQFEAGVIGVDSETDVAIVKIPAVRLSALPLADSDRLRIGDFVVAIGNPFGLGQTVTSGIVSALGRSGLGIKGYEDFIQTDASINPGNSGGALLDLNGRLVGINTAILAPTGGNIGISFAIPANMVRQLVDQLLRYGKVSRGQLGVAVQDLGSDQAESIGVRSGALVTEVLPRSTAAAAGMRAGDIVVAINDKPVRSAGALRNMIGLLRVGDQVDVDLIRNGQNLNLRARVGNRPAQQVSG